ncbi:hypothetical protein [Planctomycetes bacterium CA13]|uniref:hypothetical protein n=1 Tax=Novipirellula herctigrandis TaxID=2527986 RepID=UPI0011B408AB
MQRQNTGRLNTGRLNTGRLNTGRLNTGRLNTGRLSVIDLIKQLEPEDSPANLDRNTTVRRVSIAAIA